jgi:hypothetical protein
VTDDVFLKNSRNMYHVLDNKRYWLKYDRVWRSPLFIFNNGFSRIQFCSFRHDACRLSDMIVVRSRVRRIVLRLPCLQSPSWDQLMIHVMQPQQWTGFLNCVKKRSNMVTVSLRTAQFSVSGSGDVWTWITRQTHVHVLTHTHTHKQLIFRSSGERLSKQMRQHATSHAAVPTDPLTLISVTLLKAWECVGRLLVCWSDAKTTSLHSDVRQPFTNSLSLRRTSTDENHDSHPSLLAGVSFQHPRRKAKMCLWLIFLPPKKIF